MGSTNWVTDAQGEGYEHFTYTPYGEAWVEEHLSSKIHRMTHRFTGQELDPETGLYAFPARNYDPRTSRWLSSDPAGPELMNPNGEDGRLRPNFSMVESINWYNYVGNNPLRYVDPAGLQSADAAFSRIKQLDIQLEQQARQEMRQGGVSNLAGSRVPTPEYLVSEVDPRSEKLISGLDPSIQDKARATINQAQLEGIDARMTSGARSFAEQEALWSIGRDAEGNKIGPTKTNARGGESNHETGLAFDLGIVDPQTGNFDWNYDGNPQWNRLGEIGESLGLEWGGRWTAPYDPPHFQLRR